MLRSTCLVVCYARQNGITIRVPLGIAIQKRSINDNNIEKQIK